MSDSISVGMWEHRGRLTAFLCTLSITMVSQRRRAGTFQPLGVVPVP